MNHGDAQPAVFGEPRCRDCKPGKAGRADPPASPVPGAGLRYRAGVLLPVDRPRAAAPPAIGGHSAVGSFIGGAFRPSVDVAFRPSALPVDVIRTIEKRVEAEMSGAVTWHDDPTSAMEHDCLAQLKIAWLIEKRLISSAEDWQAKVVHYLLRRDVETARGTRIRSGREQFLLLAAAQAVLFGIRTQVYMNPPSRRPGGHRGLDDFFDSPMGLPHDRCPCCEMAALVQNGNTIVFGLRHPTSPAQNQPMTVTDVRCPPCDECVIEMNDYLGGSTGPYVLKTRTGPPPRRETIRELTFDGAVEFAVTAVAVEPR